MLAAALHRAARGGSVVLLLLAIVGWALVYGLLSAVVPGLARFQIGASVPTILLVVLFSSGVRMLGLVGRQRLLLEEMRAEAPAGRTRPAEGASPPALPVQHAEQPLRPGAQGRPGGGRRHRQLVAPAALHDPRRAEPIGWIWTRRSEQIRRLIELEKLRFSEDDDIEVTLAMSLRTCRTRASRPMLLIPLVENAFKHGIRRSAPSFVRMALSAKAARSASRWRTRSTRPGRGRPTSRPGIGLHNVRRRLELLYPGAHELTVGESGGLFRAELRLDERRGVAGDEMRDRR